MLDLHTHILPALDDGAETIEQSLIMISQLYEAGFRKIFLTPHVIEGDFFLLPGEIIKAAQELKNELKINNIDIELLPGAENYIFPDMVKYLKDGKLLTLGNKGKYILMELPMLEIPYYTEKVFFELQVEGIRPILAHPERHAVLGRKPELLLDWAQKGVLYQLDLRSIVGRYGPYAEETALKMLRSNLIHFIGSDIHTPSRRSAPFNEELELLNELVGEKMFQELTVENPQKVLDNITIEPRNDYVLNWHSNKNIINKLKGFFSRK